MRDFRSKEREEMESWREMYERCTQQRQDKLDKLKVSMYTVLYSRLACTLYCRDVLNRGSIS